MPISLGVNYKTCSKKCIEPSASNELLLFFGLPAIKTKVKASIAYITLSIPVPLQPSKSYCKANAIKCNIDKETNKCTCDLCPDGSEPELKDGQYKCECECKDGSIREQKEDGTCDCSCKCADGSEDTLAQNGCPCKCECKIYIYSSVI